MLLGQVLLQPSAQQYLFRSKKKKKGFEVNCTNNHTTLNVLGTIEDDINCVAWELCFSDT